MKKRPMLEKLLHILPREGLNQIASASGVRHPEITERETLEAELHAITFRRREIGRVALMIVERALDHELADEKRVAAAGQKESPADRRA